ncbi:MAG: hypothetical protein K9M51_01390 [Candidatus Gracilibacteria bacterium]|nr:hypothetical protein [Candidatus Gracilibacteria bacterium]
MKKYLFLVPVLLLGLGASLFLTGCETEDLKGSVLSGEELSEDEAKTAAEDFINTALMPAGQTATVKEVTEYDQDIYRITVDAAGKEIVSFLSEDGAMFFPQVMDVAEVTAQKEAQAQAAEQAKEVELADLEKKEVPHVELFVMSHCPFGTQMMKGFLPVAATLGDKIDFDLKYVNYAMHGEKELREQMYQTCISQEYRENLEEYLTCFLTDDDGPGCREEMDLDLEACVAALDEEYDIMAGFEDKSTWVNDRFPKFLVHNEENETYGVRGSPTFVLNGKVMQAARDPQSLLDTVCQGFTDAPEECDKELPSVAPAPGFGWEGEGNAAAAAACGG